MVEPVNIRDQERSLKTTWGATQSGLLHGVHLEWGRCRQGGFSVLPCPSAETSSGREAAFPHGSVRVSPAAGHIVHPVCRQLSVCSMNAF